MAKPPSIKPIRSQRGVLRAGHSEERESRDKKSRRKTREAQRQRGGRWSGGTATGRQTGGGGGAQRLLPHCSFVSESGNFLEAELRSELGGLGRGRKWRKELPLLPAETRTRLSASWSEVKPGGGALPVRARRAVSAEPRACEDGRTPRGPPERRADPTAAAAAAAPPVSARALGAQLMEEQSALLAAEEPLAPTSAPELPSAAPPQNSRTFTGLRIFCRR